MFIYWYPGRLVKASAFINVVQYVAAGCFWRADPFHTRSPLTATARAPSASASQGPLGLHLLGDLLVGLAAGAHRRDVERGDTEPVMLGVLRRALQEHGVMAEGLHLFGPLALPVKGGAHVARIA